MMKTVEILKSLENDQFVSRDDAGKLASVALKEYSRRSKAARAVENSLYDLYLAGGCPNAVYNRVEELVERYEK